MEVIEAVDGKEVGAEQAEAIIGFGAGGRHGTVCLFSNADGMTADDGQGTIGSSGGADIEGGGGEFEVVIPRGVKANADEAEEDNEVDTNPLVEVFDWAPANGSPAVYLMFVYSRPACNDF